MAPWKPKLTNIRVNATKSQLGLRSKHLSIVQTKVVSFRDRLVGEFGSIFNIAVLVFREGLECILVLAAITANLTGPRQALRRPIALGGAIGLLASFAT